jgi:recombinational DNA repair ATPase RecF
MITLLQAENVKKLQAVEIRPDGEPVILTGENEAGKSTVLDCIWMALGGNMPKEPIRQGERSAKITLEVEIDEEPKKIIVERSITSKGSYLTVKDAEGNKLSSPQKLLDGLISSLTLDPLAFSRMKPKEQRDMLLAIAGIDLTKWEADYKAAYDERTVLNREAKSTAEAASALPDAPEGTPDEAQSASDLINKAEEAHRLQRKARDAKTEKMATEQAIDSDKKEIIRLQARIKAAEERIANLVIPEAPTEAEIEAMQDQLRDIELTNSNVRSKQAKAQAKVKAQEAAKKAAEADKAVKAIEAKKAKMLESADFGIPDLFVNDDGVIFEGQPLEQQSSARTIEISAALAMKDKTKLKILIVRDASLIGTKIFTRIAEMAKERGYQLWVERFQEQPGEQGLHIVDGSIAYVNGKSQAVEAPESDSDELEVDL